MNTAQTTEKVNPCFATTEMDFKERLAAISKLRAFIAEHRDALNPFTFGVLIGANATIYFDCTYNNMNQQKEIAAAFGKDGWKRMKDPYTCGRINWRKTFDGIEIQIDGAEHLNPNLIEDVKL